MTSNGHHPRTTTAGLALAAAVTFTSCGAPAVPPDADPVLRSYDVPTAARDELRDMLVATLERGQLGHVGNGPGSTLLVVAPPHVQASIEAVLRAEPAAPPEPSQVTLTYRLIVGKPTAAPATGRPFTLVGPPRRELEPILTEIATADGPTTFALLEEIRLTSVGQGRATAVGRGTLVTQEVISVGDRIVADVSLRQPGHMESRVALTPDQFLVVGQSGYAGDRESLFPDDPGTEQLTLYYVMSATVEP